MSLHVRRGHIPTAISDPVKETVVGEAPAYTINYESLVSALQRLDMQQLIDDCEDSWHNQTLCQIGDVVVRLGVLEGEYSWHRHDEEDEFFFVLDGLIEVELEGTETAELAPREMLIVPKGLRHRLVAPIRSAVLMIARAGIVATRD